jgi:hypothetical protein
MTRLERISTYIHNQFKLQLPSTDTIIVVPMPDHEATAVIVVDARGDFLPDLWVCQAGSDDDDWCFELQPPQGERFIRFPFADDSIADYFWDHLGVDPVDAGLSELPKDSNCGRDCVKVIDSAAQMIVSCDPIFKSDIIRVANCACELYWRG